MNRLVVWALAIYALSVYLRLHPESAPDFLLPAHVRAMRAREVRAAAAADARAEGREGPSLEPPEHPECSEGAPPPPEVAAAVDYDALMQELQDLLDAADYGAAEALLIRAEEPRDEFGTRPSKRLLLPGWTNPRHHARLESWVEARPRSWRARVALGHSHHETGAEARGTAWAKDVSPEAMATLRRELGVALRLFGEARRLAPQRPEPALGFLHSAMFFGASSYPDQIAALEREALTRYAGSPELYRVLFSLRESRWGGSFRACRAFAHRVLDTFPEEPALLVLLAELSYEAQSWSAVSEEARTEVEAVIRPEELQREIQQRFIQARERHPDSIALFLSWAFWYKLHGDSAGEVPALYEAARRGSTYASTRLGDFYRAGIGVPKEPSLGRRWLCWAAHNGGREAWERLTSPSP